MKGCRPLSDTEEQAVLACLESTRFPLRNRTLFVVGCRTGFRISELLSLTIGDVLQNGTLVDRVEVARRHMKGKKEGRSVLLHAKAREAIQIWVLELQRQGYSDPETYLFASSRIGNKRLDRRSAWLMLRRAYAACGLAGKLGTHSMRKTFAKRVHAAGGKDILKTQRALNHKRLTSTASYLSFEEADVDDAILKS